MNIFESIGVALEAIVANKMRSLLTMLGIIIGISSVITIVALGDGSQKMIQKEFETFGVGRAYLGINWQESISIKDYYTQDDLDLIQSAFKDELKAISPNVGETAKVFKRDKANNVNLYGVNEQYNNIDNVKIKYGRFLMKEDISNFRFNTVIDEDFATKIFGRSDVVGESILYTVRDQSLSMTIIGVYEKKPAPFAAFGNEDTATAYAPLSVISSIYGSQDFYYGFDINLNDDVSAEETMTKIITLIERRHSAEGKDIYRYYTAESELAMVDSIMGILTLVIGAIAAISLLVGGIGVMNIMLVSVTERTKEIGIRKAIGAKYWDIMSQFLIESMIISGIGGIIGVMLGFIFSTIIALVVGFPPGVSVVSVVVATLFSSAVGVFFGFYPARKAARLDPIDALRYE